MEWQPIETAPRDGTLVLVIMVTPERTYAPAVGWWCEETGSFEYCETCVEEGVRYAHDPWQVTHWMQLPEPPK